MAVVTGSQKSFNVCANAQSPKYMPGLENWMRCISTTGYLK